MGHHREGGSAKGTLYIAGAPVGRAGPGGLQSAGRGRVIAWDPVSWDATSSLPPVAALAAAAPSLPISSQLPPCPATTPVFGGRRQGPRYLPVPLKAAGFSAAWNSLSFQILWVEVRVAVAPEAPPPPASRTLRPRAPFTATRPLMRRRLPPPALPPHRGHRAGLLRKSPAGRWKKFIESLPTLPPGKPTP